MPAPEETARVAFEWLGQILQPHHELGLRGEEQHKLTDYATTARYPGFGEITLREATASRRTCAARSQADPPVAAQRGCSPEGTIDGILV